MALYQPLSEKALETVISFQELLLRTAFNFFAESVRENKMKIIRKEGKNTEAVSHGAKSKFKHQNFEILTVGICYV